MRIDSNWYDVSLFRFGHPGGTSILDKFNGMDATDAFYSCHSKEALKKLTRLKATPAQLSDPQDDLTIKFQELRKRVAKEGLFERSWLRDLLCHVLPCIAVLLFGTAISASYPILGVAFLTLGMIMAGTIAHDHAHARNGLSRFIATVFGCAVLGLSVPWWRHTHGLLHHTYPNRWRRDPSTDTSRCGFLRFPTAECERPWRRLQNFYYPVAFLATLFIWRGESLRWAFRTHNRLALLLIGGKRCMATILRSLGCGAVQCCPSWVVLRCRVDHVPSS